MLTQEDYELFDKFARADNPLQYAMQELGLSLENAQDKIRLWLEYRYQSAIEDLTRAFERNREEIEQRYQEQKEKILPSQNQQP